MSELIIRGRFNDQRAIEDVLDRVSARPPGSTSIRRIVIDATAVVHSQVYAQAAHDSGTQFLVDPQTIFLTEKQGPDDSWARLPYGTSTALEVSDFRVPGFVDRLVGSVVDFQLAAGASAIIAPYVYLEKPSGPWAKLQVEFWRSTTRYLESLGLSMSVIPLLAVARQHVSLEINAWEAGLGRLLRAARDHTDGPTALALSATTGMTSASIHKLSVIWRRASAIGPFWAWNTGDLGMLAVTMGASGYETGMCGAERCNVRAQQANRRPGGQEPGPRWTGVYLDAMNRSLDLRVVSQLRSARGVHGDIACVDPACCARGIESTLGANRRQHAAISRLAMLRDLDGIGSTRWQLHRLEQRALAGRATAVRIRQAASALGLPIGAYPAEYQALAETLRGLRATANIAVA